MNEIFKTAHAQITVELMLKSQSIFKVQIKKTVCLDFVYILFAVSMTSIVYYGNTSLFRKNLVVKIIVHQSCDDYFSIMYFCLVSVQKKGQLMNVTHILKNTS